ncbi:MAG: 1-deoxy-D-xylulose-5-phosphate reductoisomerase [Candidatus Cloacimonadota bacterium]|nr:MAG: 1-deoxy-D-xylulose-5-phosphate reductoisomerase [Candidatus Cloacimonadota bacterium]
MKKIVILGATGSIGDSTIALIRKFSKQYQIVGAATNTSVSKLFNIADELDIPYLHIMDDPAYKSSKKLSTKAKVESSMTSLLEFLANADYDLLIAAMVGNIGLLPVLEAIKANKTIALANKETLVSGGHLVQELLKKHPKSSILPVDSEHSAIFQCLRGESKKEVKNIWLTASGGSFRNKSLEDMKSISVKDALTHPNWDMGAKITIDSSSMMNKGLEVIEARWLFDCKFDQIKVVVHPQSIIHSAVEFQDNSFIAQMGQPDMTVPISFALSYPNRNTLNHLKPLDLTTLGSLQFEAPDLTRFPCLKLAFLAGKTGHSAPTVLNAANEVAVDLFLKQKIQFLDIPKLIKNSLSHFKVYKSPNLDKILEIDNETRIYIRNNYEDIL